MHVFRFPVLVCLILAMPAWSQSAPVKPGSNNGAEVFGGFSLNSGGPLGADPGFHGGVDFHFFKQFLGVIEADHFTDTHEPSNNTSDTSILFGPRYAVPISGRNRVLVFGEVLVGVNLFRNSGQPYTYSYNNASAFAVAADGGLDYRFSRHLALRGVVGYFHDRLTNSTYGGPAAPANTASNRARVETSLVYRF